MVTTITSNTSVSSTIDWSDRPARRASTGRGVHRSCQDASRNITQTATTSTQTTSPSTVNFVGRLCLRVGLSGPPSSSNYTNEFPRKLITQCLCRVLLFLISQYHLMLSLRASTHWRQNRKSARSTKLSFDFVADLSVTVCCHAKAEPRLRIFHYVTTAALPSPSLPFPSSPLLPPSRPLPSSPLPFPSP